MRMSTPTRDSGLMRWALVAIAVGLLAWGASVAFGRSSQVVNEEPVESSRVVNGDPVESIAPSAAASSPEPRTTVAVPPPEALATASASSSGPPSTTTPAEQAEAPQASSPILVKESVAIGESASAGDDVSIRVLGLRAVTANGSGGIGDLAGPAMVVATKLVNQRADSIVLDQVVVTATVGAQDTPAPPVEHDRRSRPLAGRVESGASASGRYVFGLPESVRGPVTITVSYAGGAPNVAFTGDLAG